MLTPDPESVGRQTAEALVDSLDQLKELISHGQDDDSVRTAEESRSTDDQHP